MTAHTYPPACTECHDRDAETEDGLCLLCAAGAAWFDGMAAWGSREIAHYTRKRKDTE